MLVRQPRRVKEGAHLEENSDACEYRIRRWEYLWSHASEARSRVACHGIHHPNNVAEGRRECEQDIDSGI
jgi:hypothetical protein